LKRKHNQFYLYILLLFFVLENSLHPDPVLFPDFHKVICLNSVQGCPCYQSPERKKVKIKVFHAESVELLSSVKQSAKIKHEGGICYYPKMNLLKMKYSKVLKSKFQNFKHELIPLKTLISENQKRISEKNYEYKSLGNFWPTYYHLAMEDLHPGPKVSIITPQGKVIGRASQEFLRQVTWEGTGITETGLRIRYGFKKNRYVLSDQKQWGKGAGHGYHIYPYRTVAVNYPGICEMLGEKIKNCSKATAIGLMIYIKEVAEKNIRINGKKHDGYFCVTDTGSPHFIKKDRMDIFVGTHGGGNPYLPVQRRGNYLIEGGIENLVPSDWRLWTGMNSRVWCGWNQVPANINHPVKGECIHDYHYTARHKALSVLAVFDRSGNPVRCRKRIKLN